MNERRIHELIEQQDPEAKQRVWNKIQARLKEQNKMFFLVGNSRIEIRAVYSWFNVYVDNTLLLKHINKKATDDIVSAIKKANGKQITQPITGEKSTLNFP